jgi:hypothetical protein
MKVGALKRLVACISLVATASTAAAASPVHHPAQHAKSVARAKCRVAPADEYFGKLKMSILGIRNTIKDQGLKVDNDPEKAPSTLNAIALTEDAVHDWEHKYPCDGWLPGTIYGLEHFYAKIRTNDGVKHVHAMYAWLRRDFPRSRVIADARKEDGAAGSVPAVVPVAAGGASAGVTPP